MELRPEYKEMSERVARNAGYSEGSPGWNCCVNLTHLCQALADRPPRMLTDDEIDNAVTDLNGPRYSYARAVEAASIAKQSAPVQAEQIATLTAERDALQGQVAAISKWAKFEEYQLSSPHAIGYEDARTWVREVGLFGIEAMPTGSETK